MDRHEENHVRGTSCFAHGSFSEPQGLPRAHDAHQLSDVQRARHVFGDPDCPIRCGTPDDNVPLYEGYALRHDILRLAGRDSSEYLVTNFTEQEYSLTATAGRIARDLLEKLCYIVVDCDTELKSIDNEKTRERTDGNITEQGYSFSATAEREIVRVVIVTLCYMRLDYDTKLKSTTDFSRRRPTSSQTENIISVGAESFHFVAIFFQPSFIGKETSEFHDTSFKYNTKCNADIRRRPARPQTKTSPSVPDFSVARKCFFQPSVIGDVASGIHDTSL